MEYTIREQMMITNFYDLYFFALADELEIEDVDEFTHMVEVNEPTLRKIVQDFKKERFPNEEMDESFGAYMTLLLTERFSTDKLCEIVDRLTIVNEIMNKEE